MLPLTPEHKVKRDMEYIIYCDESVTDGKYYSDFFGGVLVRSGDFDEIKDTLEAKKQELNLLNEIKWSRVTENYLDKYIQMIDLFFCYVKQNRIKVRIMFKETPHVPSGLSPEQIQNRYSLLYYQFVKHSFGLPHHDGPADKDVYLRLYFDEIPYPLDQRDAFKAHILSLQKFWQFRKARLKIRLDDIAEINSKKHTIQQCMDIVLGAMAFVLNKKHLETTPGTNERGKRTIAKEKLFNHIIELIKESNGCELFCICETTPSKSPKDYWITPYRHWKFLPAEFRDQKCI